MSIKEPTPQQIKDQRIYAEWGLTDEEYRMISEDILHRLPNYTETGLFSVMWSEHCSYKNSKPILKKFPTSGPQVLQGPGEGAGIVSIGDGQAVVFKAESHNHPSAIEPYEGAATGVGGIIRDIFSMGARPIAILDSLRFGELNNPRTKYLFEEVVHGISGYGNCIGIPTVGGEIAFDPCYEGNPLVNAMCVGIIDQKDQQKGRASGVGNTIMYVGAKTGRDGIHGATFASEEFSAGEESQRSAVQVGDPFMEKLLLEACLECIHNHGDILIGIQDMGAAGLVSSSSEMASKAGSGLVLNLDDVPQRETHMTPYEMMLSESQERMLLCVKKGAEEQIIELFKRYDLDAVAIGHVTDDGQYRLYHQGQLVADLPVDALAEDAPTYYKPQAEPERIQQFASLPPFEPTVSDATQLLRDLLQQPTIASKKSVYETYDSMVRTNTVVGPGSDAAVLRISGTRKALAMTTDCNARYLYLNPFVGGKMAVVEAASNIVASGGKPLAITDCLNYGNPDKPEIFWELSQSADGIAAACLALDAPVISGNVSLYNETDGQAVYPTPVIGMVGLIEDIDHITTQYVKQAGDLLYVVGELPTGFSGSEVQKWQCQRIEGTIADCDLGKVRAVHDALLTAIKAGYVASAHDVSEGGLAVALAEICFGQTPLGCSVQLDVPVGQLFAEGAACFVVSVSPTHQTAFEQTVADAQKIGTVMQDGRLHVATSDAVIEADVSELKGLWEGAIPCLLKLED